MHGERDANAAAEASRTALAALFFPVQLLLDDLQALGQAAAFDDLSVAFFAFTESPGEGIFIALF